MTDDSSALYRRVIDQLVHDTLDGQGQIAARRIEEGVWNPHAPESLADQRAFSALLSRLSAQDRSVLANWFAQEFVSGVHQTLVALHEWQIPPFDKAYEGTPFHDYIGRLDGWNWPDDGRDRS